MPEFGSYLSNSSRDPRPRTGRREGRVPGKTAAATARGVALGDPPLTCAGFISAAAPATATGHSGRKGAPRGRKPGQGHLEAAPQTPKLAIK